MTDTAFQTLNWAVDLKGFSFNNLTQAEYFILGDYCFLWVDIRGTSNSKDLSFNLPLIPSEDKDIVCFAINNGVMTYATIEIRKGNNIAKVSIKWKGFDGSILDCWTTSGMKGIKADIRYKIAWPSND